MSEDGTGRIQELPKVETNSFTVILELQNSAPSQSNSYTFGSLSDFMVAEAPSDGPDSGGAAAMAGIKRRFRAGVPDAAFRSDPSGEI